jgi:signal transduction histidine kinase
MPVAMAALDVAGKLRERSPVDLAIFGEGAGRLSDRFVEPQGGQHLLARAVSEGNAEGIAWLNMIAGQRRFRVSLWRPRAGERVRVLAAFSLCEEQEVGQEAAIPQPSRPALLRIAHDLRAPLAAVMGFAERIRARPEKHRSAEIAGDAADILAAAWRLTRIVEDLDAAVSSGDTRLHLRMAEVDLARLARRIVRLAAPAAEAAGVTINGRSLSERDRPPLVIADESLLWSTIDNLLQNAIRHGGRGAVVAIGLNQSEHGLALEISDDGPGLDAETLTGHLEGSDAVGGLASCRETAGANGAELEIETAPGQGLTARLLFPAARCLNPV